MAIDLGRWKPELHPRDSKGRFRDKWGLSPKAMAAVDRLLANFNDTPALRSNAHAASYLRTQAPKRSDRQKEVLRKFLSRDGNENIQSTLRAGDKPTADITELDGMMEPLKHDLILSRVVGPDAFGLRAEDMDKVEDWSGQNLMDYGFSPMNIGDAYQVAGPHIEMRILVPKGTPALIVGGDGNSADDARTVILPREIQQQNIKIQPDGRGGWYAMSVVGAQQGTGKPARALAGRPLLARDKSPAIEATPDELARRGLPAEQAGVPTPQEQPGRFGPAQPAAGAGQRVLPQAPTVQSIPNPAATGPVGEAPPAVAPAKAIKKAGGQVPVGSGQVVGESTDLTPRKKITQRPSHGVVGEDVAQAADAKQRADAAEKAIQARQARLDAAEKVLQVREARAAEERAAAADHMAKANDAQAKTIDQQSGLIDRLIGQTSAPAGQPQQAAQPEKSEGGTTTAGLSETAKDNVLRRVRPEGTTDEDLRQQKLAKAIRAERGLPQDGSADNVAPVKKTARAAPAAPKKAPTAAPTKAASGAGAPEISADELRSAASFKSEHEGDLTPVERDELAAVATNDNLQTNYWGLRSGGLSHVKALQQTQELKSRTALKAAKVPAKKALPTRPNHIGNQIRGNQFKDLRPGDVVEIPPRNGRPAREATVDFVDQKNGTVHFTDDSKITPAGGAIKVVSQGDLKPSRAAQARAKKAADKAVAGLGTNEAIRGGRTGTATVGRTGKAIKVTPEQAAKNLDNKVADLRKLQVQLGDQAPPELPQVIDGLEKEAARLRGEGAPSAAEAKKTTSAVKRAAKKVAKERLPGESPLEAERPATKKAARLAKKTAPTIKKAIPEKSVAQMTDQEVFDEATKINGFPNGPREQALRDAVFKRLGDEEAIRGFHKNGRPLPASAVRPGDSVQDVDGNWHRVARTETVQGNRLVMYDRAGNTISEISPVDNIPTRKGRVTKLAKAAPETVPVKAATKAIKKAAPAKPTITRAIPVSKMDDADIVAEAAKIEGAPETPRQRAVQRAADRINAREARAAKKAAPAKVTKAPPTKKVAEKAAPVKVAAPAKAPAKAIKKVAPEKVAKAAPERPTITRRTAVSKMEESEVLAEAAKIEGTPQTPRERAVSRAADRINARQARAAKKATPAVKAAPAKKVAEKKVAKAAPTKAVKKAPTKASTIDKANPAESPIEPKPARVTAPKTDQELAAEKPVLKPRFTAARGAKEYRPSKLVKTARLVDTAPDGHKLGPDEETTITVDYGNGPELQSFRGPWMEVLGPDGSRSYGSALKEWNENNERVRGAKDGWVKITPVTAYRHTGPPRRVETVIKKDGKLHNETGNTAVEGDWIVRQPNGEVMVTKDAEFQKRYQARTPRSVGTHAVRLRTQAQDAKAKEVAAKKVAAAKAVKKVAAKAARERPVKVTRRAAKKAAVPEERASRRVGPIGEGAPEQVEPAFISTRRVTPGDIQVGDTIVRGDQRLKVDRIETTNTGRIVFFDNKGNASSPGRAVDIIPAPQERASRRINPVGAGSPGTVNPSASAIKRGDRIMVTQNADGQWVRSMNKGGATPLTVDRVERALAGNQSGYVFHGKTDDGKDISTAPVFGQNVFKRAPEKVAPAKATPAKKVAKTALAKAPAKKAAVKATPVKKAAAPTKAEPTKKVAKAAPVEKAAVPAAAKKAPAKAIKKAAPEKPVITRRPAVASMADEEVLAEAGKIEGTPTTPRERAISRKAAVINARQEREATRAAKVAAKAAAPAKVAKKAAPEKKAATKAVRKAAGAPDEDEKILGPVLSQVTRAQRVQGITDDKIVTNPAEAKAGMYVYSGGRFNKLVRPRNRPGKGWFVEDGNPQYLGSMPQAQVDSSVHGYNDMARQIEAARKKVPAKAVKKVAPEKAATKAVKKVAPEKAAVAKVAPEKPTITRKAAKKVAPEAAPEAGAPAAAKKAAAKRGTKATATRGITEAEKKAPPAPVGTAKAVEATPTVRAADSWNPGDGLDTGLYLTLQQGLGKGNLKNLNTLDRETRISARHKNVPAAYQAARADLSGNPDLQAKLDRWYKSTFKEAKGGDLTRPLMRRVPKKAGAEATPRKVTPATPSADAAIRSRLTKLSPELRKEVLDSMTPEQRKAVEAAVGRADERLAARKVGKVAKAATPEVSAPAATKTAKKGIKKAAPAAPVKAAKVAEKAAPEKPAKKRVAKKVAEAAPQVPAKKAVRPLIKRQGKAVTSAQARKESALEAVRAHDMGRGDNETLGQYRTIERNLQSGDYTPSQAKGFARREAQKWRRDARGLDKNKQLSDSERVSARARMLGAGENYDKLADAIDASQTRDRIEAKRFGEASTPTPSKRVAKVVAKAAPEAPAAVAKKAPAKAIKKAAPTKAAEKPTVTRKATAKKAVESTTSPQVLEARKERAARRAAEAAKPETPAQKAARADAVKAAKAAESRVVAERKADDKAHAEFVKPILKDAGVKEADLSELDKTGLRVVADKLRAGKISKATAARRLRTDRESKLNNIADAIEGKPRKAAVKKAAVKAVAAEKPTITRKGVRAAEKATPAKAPSKSIKKTAPVAKKAAPEAPAAKKVAEKGAPEKPTIITRAEKRAATKAAKVAAPKVVAKKAVPKATAKLDRPAPEGANKKLLDSLTNDEIGQINELSPDSQDKYWQRRIARDISHDTAWRSVPKAGAEERIAELRRPSQPLREGEVRPAGTGGIAELRRPSAQFERPAADNRRLTESEKDAVLKQVRDAKANNPNWPFTAQERELQREAEGIETARTATRKAAKAAPRSRVTGEEIKPKKIAPAMAKARAIRAQRYDDAVPDLPGQEGNILRKAKEDLAAGESATSVKQRLTKRAEYFRDTADIGRRTNADELEPGYVARMEGYADRYEKAAELAGKRIPAVKKAVKPGEKVAVKDLVDGDVAILKGKKGTFRQPKPRTTFIEFPDGTREPVKKTALAQMVRDKDLQLLGGDHRANAPEGNVPEAPAAKKTAKSIRPPRPVTVKRAADAPGNARDKRRFEAAGNKDTVKSRVDELVADGKTSPAAWRQALDEHAGPSTPAAPKATKKATKTAKVAKVASETPAEGVEKPKITRKGAKTAAAGEKFLPPLADGTRRKSATNLKPGDKVRTQNRRGAPAREVESVDPEAGRLRVRFTDGTSTLDNPNTAHWMADNSPSERALLRRRPRPSVDTSNESPTQIARDLAAGRITRAEARDRIRRIPKSKLKEERQAVRNAESRIDMVPTRPEKRASNKAERAARRAELKDRRDRNAGRGVDALTQAHEEGINTRDSEIRRALEADGLDRGPAARRRLESSVTTSRQQANLLDYGTVDAPNDLSDDFVGGASARSRRLRRRAQERSRALDMLNRRGAPEERSSRRVRGPAGGDNIDTSLEARRARRPVKTATPGGESNVVPFKRPGKKAAAAAPEGEAPAAKKAATRAIKKTAPEVSAPVVKKAVAAKKAAPEKPTVTRKPAKGSIVEWRTDGGKVTKGEIVTVPRKGVATVQWHNGRRETGVDVGAEGLRVRNRRANEAITPHKAAPAKAIKKATPTKATPEVTPEPTKAAKAAAKKAAAGPSPRKALSDLRASERNAKYGPDGPSHIDIDKVRGDVDLPQDKPILDEAQAMLNDGQSPRAVAARLDQHAQGVLTHGVYLHGKHHSDERTGIAEIDKARKARAPQEEKELAKYQERNHKLKAVAEKLRGTRRPVARKAAPAKAVPETPPAKKATRAIKKATPEATPGRPVKVTRKAAKATPETTTETPAVKKAARSVKKVAAEVAPEQPVKKVAAKKAAKKAIPEKLPTSAAGLARLGREQGILGADELSDGELRRALEMKRADPNVVPISSELIPKEIKEASSEKLRAIGKAGGIELEGNTPDELREDLIRKAIVQAAKARLENRRPSVARKTSQAAKKAAPEERSIRRVNPPSGPEVPAAARPEAPSREGRVRDNGMIPLGKLVKGDRIMVTKKDDGTATPSTRIGDTPITVDRVEVSQGRRGFQRTTNLKTVIGHDDNGNEIRVTRQGNGYPGHQTFRMERLEGGGRKTAAKKLIPEATKATPEAPPAKKATRVAKAAATTERPTITRRSDRKLTAGQQSAKDLIQQHSDSLRQESSSEDGWVNAADINASPATLRTLARRGDLEEQEVPGARRNSVRRQYRPAGTPNASGDTTPSEVTPTKRAVKKTAPGTPAAAKAVPAKRAVKAAPAKKATEAPVKAAEAAAPAAKAAPRRTKFTPSQVALLRRVQADGHLDDDAALTTQEKRDRNRLRMHGMLQMDSVKRGNKKVLRDSVTSDGRAELDKIDKPPAVKKAAVAIKKTAPEKVAVKKVAKAAPEKVAPAKKVTPQVKKAEPAKAAKAAPAAKKAAPAKKTASEAARPERPVKVTRAAEKKAEAPEAPAKKTTPAAETERPKISTTEGHARFDEAGNLTGSTHNGDGTHARLDQIVNPNDPNFPDDGIPVKDFRTHGEEIKKGRLTRHNGVLYLAEEGDGPGDKERRERTLKEVQAWHDTLPEGQKKYVKSIVSLSNPSSRDSDVARHRGLEKFESAASAGNGQIAIYKHGGAGHGSSRDTLDHELGHLIDQDGINAHRFGSKSEAWRDAGRSDNNGLRDRAPGFNGFNRLSAEDDDTGGRGTYRFGITKYGTSDPGEDFAESYAGYRRGWVGSIDDPDNPGRRRKVHFRELYPARAAIFDRMFPEQAQKQRKEIAEYMKQDPEIRELRDLPDNEVWSRLRPMDMTQLRSVAKKVGDGKSKYGNTREGLIRHIAEGTASEQRRRLSSPQLQDLRKMSREDAQKRLDSFYSSDIHRGLMHEIGVESPGRRRTRAEMTKAILDKLHPESGSSSSTPAKKAAKAATPTKTTPAAGRPTITRKATKAAAPAKAAKAARAKTAPEKPVITRKATAAKKVAPEVTPAKAAKAAPAKKAAARAATPTATPAPATTAKDRLPGRQKEARIRKAQGSVDLASSLLRASEAFRRGDNPDGFMRAARQDINGATPGDLSNKRDTHAAGWDELKKALGPEKNWDSPEKLDARLREVLKKRGITIDHNPGEMVKFDPNSMEAFDGTHINPGDEVRVVHPGLSFTDKDGTVHQLRPPTVTRRRGGDTDTGPLAPNGAPPERASVRSTQRTRTPGVPDRTQRSPDVSDVRPTVLTGRQGRDISDMGPSGDTDPGGMPVKDYTLRSGYHVAHGTLFKRDRIPYLIEHEDTPEGKAHAEEIQKALAIHRQSLPLSKRRLQRSYSWVGGRNPKDAEFAKRHGVDPDDWLSEATSDSLGGVTVYNRDEFGPAGVTGSLDHEFAHSLDHLGSEEGLAGSDSKAWHDAGASDDIHRRGLRDLSFYASSIGDSPVRLEKDRASSGGDHYPNGVTDYGTAHAAEDYAESFRLYRAGVIAKGRRTEGGPIEPLWFRDLFPARAAILDKAVPDFAEKQLGQISDARGQDLSPAQREDQIKRLLTERRDQERNVAFRRLAEGAPTRARMRTQTRPQSRVVSGSVPLGQDIRSAFDGDIGPDGVEIGDGGLHLARHDYTIKNGRAWRDGNNLYIVEGRNGPQMRRQLKALRAERARLPKELGDHTRTFMVVDDHSPSALRRLEQSGAPAGMGPFASAGDGSVTFWGRRNSGLLGQDGQFASTLRHEASHNSDTAFGTPSLSPEWLGAAQAGAKGSRVRNFDQWEVPGQGPLRFKQSPASGRMYPDGVTPYALSNGREDWAEASEFYFGTDANGGVIGLGSMEGVIGTVPIWFRDLFPARAAILDRYYPEFAAQQLAEIRRRRG